jgi:hypothetical protein
MLRDLVKVTRSSRCESVGNIGDVSGRFGQDEFLATAESKAGSDLPCQTRGIF